MALCRQRRKNNRSTATAATTAKITKTAERAYLSNINSMGAVFSDARQTEATAPFPSYSDEATTQHASKLFNRTHAGENMLVHTTSVPHQYQSEPTKPRQVPKGRFLYRVSAGRFAYVCAHAKQLQVRKSTRWQESREQPT